MQMVINQVDYGMNPQTSLDAPRWRYDGGLSVAVEAHAPREVIEGLAARGHEVTVMEPTFNHGFGRGQIIRRLTTAPSGGLGAALRRLRGRLVEASGKWRPSAKLVVWDAPDSSYRHECQWWLDVARVERDFCLDLDLVVFYA